jgi:hypothetical protein
MILAQEPTGASLVMQRMDLIETWPAISASPCRWDEDVTQTSTGVSEGIRTLSPRALISSTSG